MRTTLIALILSAGLGCDSDDAPKKLAQPAVPGPAAAPAPAATPPAGAGSLSGRVRIKGDVPKSPRIAMNTECALACAGKEMRSEAVVADAEKNVKWAAVYIKSGLGGKKYDPPGGEVLVDQQGCTYRPHVFAAMVGQPVRVRNSDPFMHNVHGLPFDCPAFNFAQVKGQENVVTFKLPETSIKVKCDVHAWMGAWGHVFDHPFFAITDDAGKFAIAGVPAGKYTLEVWQEAYKSVSQTVEVKPGETSDVTFELVEKKE